MHFLSFVAYGAGWLRGGHSERFAVSVMIIGYAYSSIAYRWRIDDFYWGSAIEGVVLLLIFGWLALRSDRWWPFVATAAMGLIMLVHVLSILVPDLSRYSAVSARLGLWMVADAALLAGVAERWLAGEKPVSSAAVWRRRFGVP